MSRLVTREAEVQTIHLENLKKSGNAKWSRKSRQSLSLFGWLLNKKAARVEVNILLAFLHWVRITFHPWPFIFDIAIFVLKRDIKLQLTNLRVKWPNRQCQSTEGRIPLEKSENLICPGKWSRCLNLACSWLHNGFRRQWHRIPYQEFEAPPPRPFCRLYSKWIWLSHFPKVLFILWWQVTCSLWARWPSCHPTNSVKAPKETESVDPQPGKTTHQPCHFFIQFETSTKGGRLSRPMDMCSPFPRLCAYHSGCRHKHDCPRRAVPCCSRRCRTRILEQEDVRERERHFLKFIKIMKVNDVCRDTPVMGSVSATTSSCTRDFTVSSTVVWNCLPAVLGVLLLTVATFIRHLKA